MADEERELEKTNQSKFRKRKTYSSKPRTKIDADKKIRDRDRDTHTERGVRDRSIDRSIKGRESEQYLEMHEDEGEATIAAAAAAVRKNQTAEEKSSRADALARKKRDSAMALVHLGRDRGREGECAGLGSTGRGRRSSRLPEKKGARGGGKEK